MSLSGTQEILEIDKSTFISDYLKINDKKTVDDIYEFLDVFNEQNYEKTNLLLCFRNYVLKEDVMFGETQDSEHFISQIENKEEARKHKFIVFVDKNVLIDEPAKLEDIFYSNNIEDVLLKYRELILKSLKETEEKVLNGNIKELFDIIDSCSLLRYVFNIPYEEICKIYQTNHSFSSEKNSFIENKYLNQKIVFGKTSELKNELSSKFKDIKFKSKNEYGVIVLSQNKIVESTYFTNDFQDFLFKTKSFILESVQSIPQKQIA